MLTIHFLNVGHGDCTVIEHPDGRLTVIDINNGGELDATTAQELSDLYGIPRFQAILRKNLGESNIQQVQKAGYDVELTNPIEFLKRRYSTPSIFRYIQTHPDLDHFRGLSALASEGIYITNFWDTAHTKTPDDPSNEDWQMYQWYRSGTSQSTRTLYLQRGSQNQFWTQDGFEILSPTPSIMALVNRDEKWNDASYVLRITYAGISVVLGGDAGHDVWENLVATYGQGLRCHVLKASHHGRESGCYADALKLLRPKYTIVSVGKKPDQDASNTYRYYSENVWSTRWRGDITLTIEDRGEARIGSQYDR